MVIVAVFAVFAAAPSAFAESAAVAGYSPKADIIDTLPSTTSGGPSAVGPATSVNVENKTPTEQSNGTPTPSSSAPTTQTETAAASSLPFTGFDAGLVAVMGLVLLGTGAVLRRSSRSAKD